jgi:FKBP-type peptidyl-prolyl cis-trans isomerase
VVIRPEASLHLEPASVRFTSFQSLIFPVNPMDNLMQKFVIALICSLVATVSIAQDNSLDTPEKEIGYILGRDMGTNMEQIRGQIDIDAFVRGIQEALNGTESPIAAADAEKTKQAFYTKMNEQRQAEQKAAIADREKLGPANLAGGEAFLAANGKKAGWNTTASGLQYKVVKQGDGPKPAATDSVTVHYRGTLMDGTEFDSSFKRNKPATFPLNGVIKGWTEGVQLMAVGSTYTFAIHPDQAS